MDSKKVLDLIFFLDVCQVYFQTRKKNLRDIYTLWAIITFVRDEDSAEFLRWCRAFNVKHLRECRDEKIVQKKKLSRTEKICLEKRILRVLQELFYCGCLPNN
ncbi:GSCOCG00008616001-RA-CDS [Cotesia congregata]|nr:GSCOCG00008616001-RA-CDS [Cotesia congregata]